MDLQQYLGSGLVSPASSRGGNEENVPPSQKLQDLSPSYLNKSPLVTQRGTRSPLKAIQNLDAPLTPAAQKILRGYKSPKLLRSGTNLAELSPTRRLVFANCDEATSASTPSAHFGSTVEEITPRHASRNAPGLPPTPPAKPSFMQCHAGMLPSTPQRDEDSNAPSGSMATPMAPSPTTSAALFMSPSDDSAAGWAPSLPPSPVADATGLDHTPASSVPTSRAVCSDTPWSTDLTTPGGGHSGSDLVTPSSEQSTRHHDKKSPETSESVRAAIAASRAICTPQPMTARVWQALRDAVGRGLAVSPMRLMDLSSDGPAMEHSLCYSTDGLEHHEADVSMLSSLPSTGITTRALPRRRTEDMEASGASISTEMEEMRDDADDDDATQMTELEGLRLLIDRKEQKAQQQEAEAVGLLPRGSPSCSMEGRGGELNLAFTPPHVVKQQEAFGHGSERGDGDGAAAAAAAAATYNQGSPQALIPATAAEAPVLSAGGRDAMTFIPPMSLPGLASRLAFLLETKAEVAVQTDEPMNSRSSCSSSSLVAPPPSPRSFPPEPCPRAAMACMKSPCLVFREGRWPVLQQGMEAQRLEEVRLAAVVGEMVEATIPAFCGEVSADLQAQAQPPLVIKATIFRPRPAAPQILLACKDNLPESTTDQELLHSLPPHRNESELENDDGPFSVSPTYVSLFCGRPTIATLRIRLLADEPGDYSATLRLEYMGVRADVALSALVKTKDDGVDEWLPTGEEAALQSEQVDGAAAGGVPAMVTWDRLRVGCAATRELRLRNVLSCPVLVRANVEGADREAFQAQGEEEVRPGGIMRIEVGFRPVRAGVHRSTLRVVVWEAGASSTRAHLRSRDGMLDCWIGSGRRVYSVGMTGMAVAADVKPLMAIEGPKPEDTSVSVSSAAENDQERSDDGSEKEDNDDAFSIGGDSFMSLKVMLPPSMSSPVPSTTTKPRQPPPPPPRPGCNSAAPSCSSRNGSSSVLEGLRPLRAVFFSSSSVAFGIQDVGSLTTVKVALCNPLYEPQLAIIEPVGLPYIVVHRCVRLKPRSFVRLPIRFSPVGRGRFELPLKVTVHSLSDGARDGEPSDEPRTLSLMLTGEADAGVQHTC